MCLLASNTLILRVWPLTICEFTVVSSKLFHHFLFRLPFTYSLGEGQFEELKDGKNQARRGEKGDCWKETECLGRKGYCLKVTDFMVGFGRDREYLRPMLMIGGNSHFLSCQKIFFPKFFQLTSLWYGTPLWMADKRGNSANLTSLVQTLFSCSSSTAIGTG